MDKTLPFWYEAPTDDIPGAVFAVAEHLEEDQSELRQNWKRYAHYYSNREEACIDFESTLNHIDTAASRVPDNVVKSTIDTAASIIAKNQVRVRVLTNGARFLDQQKAKRLEKYLYGEMKYAKVWDVGPLIFRDSCVFGTGVLKIFPEDGKVKLERVLISNLLINEEAAIDGLPRELHERRLVDKDVLIQMFPQYQSEITLAASRDLWSNQRVPHNQVVVIESYRLPDGPKSAGKHTVCVEGVCLSEEDYTCEEFPYVFYRWDGLPLTGFYGLGLARLLQGYQERINELNAFIRKCQDLIAVPRVFVDMGSKLLKVQLDNRVGAIIPYRGKPPTFFTPQALNAEIYSYKDQLKRDALAEAGISQLSSQSLKPAGLESAVALREYSDIESSRFVIQAQRYERFYLEVGQRMLEVAAKLYKGKSHKTKFPNRNAIEEIDWKDVDFERDRFMLDIQAASLLSMTPAARLQAVTELAQVGQLDKAEIRYLLNHPDLERSSSLAYADFNDIQRVEELLLSGEYEAPEPFQNLELGLKRLQLLYLKIQSDFDDVPEDILENIRTWISQAKTELEMAAQAGVPQEPAMPGAVEEAPLAGGVAGSDVIQNLPGQIAG